MIVSRYIFNKLLALCTMHHEKGVYEGGEGESNDQKWE
jgi:hypothetical protein